MLVPISWLKEFVDLSLWFERFVDLSLSKFGPASIRRESEELAERLTLAGMEVESIQRLGDWWDTQRVVVGEVLAVRKHPDADRLVLVDVNYGENQSEQVVTGAVNLFPYLDRELPVLKVPFARAGAVLIDAYSDERPRPRKKLKSSKIRGIPSNGMICSGRELGLSDEHEGIMLLPEDAPVGVSLGEYLGDEVLEIALTPDMGRCLSILGVAREVAALTDIPLRTVADLSNAEPDADSTTDDAAIIIENTNLCHRYIGLLVSNVQVHPSPLWMQTRLRNAGTKPINNVVDITNYVMLELGQPLHAFDYDILVQRAKAAGRSKPEIIVRPAHFGEKITTLDGVDRDLDESMLLITDAAGPVAIAGVMGGVETAIHERTRNIYLESATFDGINNRRTAQKLKLHTDASHRFTRGVPATLNAIAAKRAADLLSQHASGTATSGKGDNYPVPQAKQDAYLTASTIYRQFGTAIDLEVAAAALRKLDFETEIGPGIDSVSAGSYKSILGLSVNPGESVLRCTAPWYRLDVQYPADLIEEIARMIGYDRIKATMLVDALPTQRRNVVVETEQRIREILIGGGLQETINYSLTTPEIHEKLNIGAGTTEPGTSVSYVTLANPLSSTRRVMRRSLLVSAVENLAYNTNFADRLLTFEIGHVYLPEKGEGVRPFEDLRLSISLIGSRRRASIYPDPAGVEEFDFFDLKGIVETLLDRLGLIFDDVEYVAKTDSQTFTPNCAEIKIKGESMGLMGELHPNVRDAFDLPSHSVYLAELRVEPLIRPSWQLDMMSPISNYPAVIEDLAFVVAESVTARQVLDAIRHADNTLLAGVELFDVYRGEPLSPGYKSFAFKLTYQRLDSTLSDDEVTRLRNRIISKVREEVGGVLRGI